MKIVIVIFGLMISILMLIYSIHKRMKNKSSDEYNSDIMLFNKNIECGNPMELSIGEVIFCPEIGMFYKRIDKGFIPMISEKNHIAILEKYGAERTLTIVRENVSMQLFHGTIIPLYCYSVKFELIQDKIISNNIK